MKTFQGKSINCHLLKKKPEAVLEQLVLHIFGIFGRNRRKIVKPEARHGQEDAQHLLELLDSSTFKKDVARTVSKSISACNDKCEKGVLQKSGRTE